MVILIILPCLMLFGLATANTDYPVTTKVNAHSDYPVTSKEIPFYLRQSWAEVIKPYLTTCIAETKVNPTSAFRSVMFTEIPNDARLKCYFKCISIKLNLMEATTGEFIEKEILRQLEGVTPEIFKKCNDKSKCETDLCKKTYDMYLCFVHSIAAAKPHHPIPEKPHCNKN